MAWLSFQSSFDQSNKWLDLSNFKPFPSLWGGGIRETIRQNHLCYHIESKYRPYINGINTQRNYRRHGQECPTGISGNSIRRTFRNEIIAWNSCFPLVGLFNVIFICLSSHKEGNKCVPSSKPKPCSLKHPSVRTQQSKVDCAQQVPWILSTDPHGRDPKSSCRITWLYSGLSHHMVTLFTEPMGVRDPDITFHSDSLDWTEVQRETCLEEWLTQGHTFNYWLKLQLEPISLVSKNMSLNFYLFLLPWICWN